VPIQDLIATFQTQTLALEAEATERLIESYRLIHQRLAAEQAELLARFAGKEMTKAAIVKDAGYKRLLRNVQAEMDRYGAVIGDTVDIGRQQAAQLALDQAEALTRAALEGLPAQAQASIMATFNRMPREAVEALTAALHGDSPLVRLVLNDFGEKASKEIGQALLTNVAAGRHPTAIAREMVRAWGVPLTRANAISRTEHLRAHRSATIASYRQNAHIVKTWTWHAQLDTLTCMSCVAKHGTEWPLSETLDDHVSGRCGMIPNTPTWEELGFEGMPDTAVHVEPGESWFNELSEAEQRKMMGPKIHDGWREGKVPFADLSKEVNHPDWGRSYVQASGEDLGL